MNSVNLFSKSIANLRWATLDFASKQLMQLVTTIVLARFLLPSDFGLIGMTLVVVGFVAIFKDLGTGAAVIRSDAISDSALSSIFWVNVMFGSIITIVLMLSASLIAQVFNDPAVTPLIRLISITFIISSVTVLQQALLQRDLLFEKLAKINMVSTLAGSIVGIMAAIQGAGAMSLVYQSISLNILSSVLLWTSARWRPQFKLNWSELDSVKSFSLNLSGFNIFNYLSRNVDYLLIGSFLGAAALGYYTLAYQIMLYPVLVVSSVVSRVMFPAYTQIQNDDARLGRAYIRMITSISWVTFPTMVAIGTVSHSLIASVFGPTWSPVAPILMVLASVGLIQSISTTVSTLYQTKGRADWMFRWSMVTGVVRIIAFAIGLRWGVMGVAIAYALTTFALFYHNFAIPFRLINLEVQTLFRAIVPPLHYSMLMLASIVLTQTILSMYEFYSPYLILASSTVVGLCTYGGVLWWKRPPTFLDALRVLPFQLPSRLSK